MKLRFAPSPTGFLHVGGARTAIFNYLHAQRYGGSLILRIEDTDVERSRQHHAEQIVSSLQWLGVKWDDGPVYQSDRLERYRERAFELVERGLAYRCYCTIDELEREREEAEKSGRQYRYSGRCRAGALQDGRESFVVRFKVEPSAIEFDDLIRGHVRFEGQHIDDFVLLRSDGYPTYHLSVVVDDIDMEVTIVARGDDHLSNTPKHILLFRAFDAPVPEFAHVPLILGPDKKRLSKRFGATSCEEYRSIGILPHALFNFLTLLGWSPGGDREVMSHDQAIQTFDLRDVNKSAAVFDQEKLVWINSQYLQKMRPEQIFPHLQPFLPPEVDEIERLFRVIELNQQRAKTLVELAEITRPYFADDQTLEYEADAVKKHVRGAELDQRMRDLQSALESVEPFTPGATESALRALAEASGVSAAKYIHPLRLAVLGKGASPGIFDVLEALGKERTLRRVARFIDALPALQQTD